MQNKTTPKRVPGKQIKRNKIMVSRSNTFGFDPEMDVKVEAWSAPTRMTPKIDPDYVFPELDTKFALIGFSKRDRVLATGPTGSGKTSLFEQIAARLNYGVVKISFDSCISRNDLLGEWVVKGKEMEFQYGILPTAMQEEGTVIILDEWDTQNEDVSFVIQRLLQKDDGNIMLMENKGELIPLHPDNVVVATANTCGQGDDSGLYSQGTRVQNYAQINRFGITLRMNYLDAESEKKILSNKFPLESVESEAFIQAINKVRDGFYNGQLSVPLSTRDLINWVEKYLTIGNPILAATYCFLNRMSIEDAEVCEGIIQRSFAE